MFELTKYQENKDSSIDFETKYFNFTGNEMSRHRSRKFHSILPDHSYTRVKLKYARISHKKSHRYNWAFSPSQDIWSKSIQDELTQQYRCNFSHYINFWRCIDYYQIEPVEIPYISYKNTRGKYVPLMLVTFNKVYPTATMPPVLIDVRSKENITNNWKWFYPAWREANRFAKTRGWNFCLINDDFFQTPLYYNASKLLDFRYYPLNSGYYKRLLKNMDILQITTVKNLLDKTSHNKKEFEAMIPQLFYLIEKNYISFNFWLPLRLDSTIYSTN